MHKHETILGGLVARSETTRLAMAAMPVTSMLREDDKPEHRERLSSLKHVERYGKPYYPLIMKHRRAEA